MVDFVVLAVAPNDSTFKIQHRTLRGVHISPSFVREIGGVAGHRSSPFESIQRPFDEEVENFFEAVRNKFYSELPSRYGAISAFPDIASALIANQEWWDGQRLLYSASVIEGSKTLTADSNWLDCSPGAYEENAHRYFQGKMSDAPCVEILIHGGVRAARDALNFASARAIRSSAH